MQPDELPSVNALGAMMITDVLERWPATADVFHGRAMACVGCAVAPFYTISDAAHVYGFPPEEFAAELLLAIRESVEQGTHE